MTDDSQADRLDRLEALVERQQSAIEAQRETIESQHEQIERLQRSQRATVELVADGGQDNAKVIGHNKDTDGEPIGVWGEVDGDGYGLATPDDARIDGAIEASSELTLNTDEGTRALKLGVPGQDSWDNTAGASIVAGHPNNTVDDAVGATIAGGGNDDDAEDGENRVFGDYGTIGGGRGNEATRREATIGGGRNNEADGNESTIAGGGNNEAINLRTTVGGGNSNTASGSRSTVAGGEDNEASDFHATVGGGNDNVASGSYATVAGGEDNEASRRAATVPGGRDNHAEGRYSFAAGREAKAEHDGSVVFGDSSEDEISSTAEDQVRFQQDINGRGDVSVSGVLSGFEGIISGPRVLDPTADDLNDGWGMLFVSSGAPDVTGFRGDLVYAFNDDGDVETTVVQSNPS